MRWRTDYVIDRWLIAGPAVISQTTQRIALLGMVQIDRIPKRVWELNNRAADVRESSNVQLPGNMHHFRRTCSRRDFKSQRSQILPSSSSARFRRQARWNPLRRGGSPRVTRRVIASSDRFAQLCKVMLEANAARRMWLLIWSGKKEIVIQASFEVGQLRCSSRGRCGRTLRGVVVSCMPLGQSGFRLSLLPIPQHSFQRPYRPLSLRRLGTRLLAAFQPSRLAPPSGPIRLEPLELKHLLELDRPLELLGRVPEKGAECAPAAPSIRLSSARGIAQTVSKTACLAAFLGGPQEIVVVDNFRRC